jgi:Tim44-like domain
MTSSHTRLGLVKPLLTVVIVLAAETCWARAGGGGGGGGKGSWINIFVLPFFIIYSAVLTYQVKTKSDACKNLLARLEKLDPAWDLDRIRHRVDEVFFKVQQAWMERNQDLAKDCMSPALHQKHKLQTDQLIAQHRKNVLENINLIEVRIVDVEDFVDNKKDLFWAHIKASMIDYTIDDTTDRVLSGNRDKAEAFTELWKFVRAANTWVLDEIDQKVSVSDLSGFAATSETAPS